MTKLQLSSVIDIVSMPRQALKSVRATPTWIPSFLLVATLIVIGYFLQQPALHHALLGTVRHALASDPASVAMTEESKQRLLRRITHPPMYATVLSIVALIATPFVASLLNTAVLLIGSWMAHGSGTFRTLFSGSMMITLPTFGIYAIVVGIISRLLGVEHFATIADLYREVPSLIFLAPDISGRFGAFLTSVQVFTSWGFVLNTLMMRETASVRTSLAWIFPLFIFSATVFAQSFASPLD